MGDYAIKSSLLAHAQGRLTGSCKSRLAIKRRRQPVGGIPAVLSCCSVVHPAHCRGEIKKPTTVRSAVRQSNPAIVSVP